jgi:hypothetical protein
MKDFLTEIFINEVVEPSVLTINTMPGLSLFMSNVPEDAFYKLIGKFCLLFQLCHLYSITPQAMSVHRCDDQIGYTTLLALMSSPAKTLERWLGKG